MCRTPSGTEPPQGASESDLDDPQANELWKRLVLAHGASGQIEISTMIIDGEIAGFTIGIIDDDTYRVFDGHFNSEFHRYSPGRIIEAAVLERVVVDARFGGLDWMAGVAAEKILASNHNEGRMQLVASSRATTKPAPKPIPDHAANNVVRAPTGQSPVIETPTRKKESSLLFGNI